MLRIASPVSAAPSGAKVSSTRPRRCPAHLDFPHRDPLIFVFQGPLNRVSFHATYRRTGRIIFQDFSFPPWSIRDSNFCITVAFSMFCLSLLMISGLADGIHAVFSVQGLRRQKQLFMFHFYLQWSCGKGAGISDERGMCDAVYRLGKGCPCRGSRFWT